MSIAPDPAKHRRTTYCYLPPPPPLPLYLPAGHQIQGPDAASCSLSAQVFEPADGSPVNNRIFWTYNATVRLAILPVAEFCNGHVFFVQQLHVRNSIAPYVVHNTFQFYYGPGKVARFRHFGLWLLDPPEYVSPLLWTSSKHCWP